MWPASVGCRWHRDPLLHAWLVLGRARATSQTWMERGQGQGHHEGWRGTVVPTSNSPGGP